MAISAVVVDWYATLAKPNPDDFWTRLADEIAEAGEDPRPDVLAAWDVEHPVEHTRHSTDATTYRAWQRARLEWSFGNRVRSDGYVRRRMTADRFLNGRLCLGLGSINARLGDLRRRLTNRAS